MRVVRGEEPVDEALDDRTGGCGRGLERAYDRPIPRVYYQSVRPTAICRVGFLRDKSGWPKERGVARCTDFR
jgi:hypothetical protein